MPAERVLVDAGPLFALLYSADKHHSECVATLKTVRGPLLTVWPAVTEAAYILSSHPPGPDMLLTWIERGNIRILDAGEGEIPRVRELMRKYADLPMDLADAVLVAVAERELVETVFTTDRRDFGVYRPRHARAFKVIPKR